VSEQDAGLGRDAQQQSASASEPDAREQSTANAPAGGVAPGSPAANAPAASATPHIHPAEAAIQLTPNRPGPAAHPALPAPELDRIVIERLHVHGRHGVFAHERANGQDFYIDAEVWIDTRAAAASDEIEQTVHYGHLMRALY
jgi:dihydroneopterin aldolase/2-amino-4-hydroxy-6-hydroxymethyldihydropteridine diphosphokinase